MKLTKSVVDHLAAPIPVPPATKAQAFYRDDRLRGFAVRVTSAGAKTFIVEKRVNKQVRRMTIGRYGDLTVEQARKEAQKLLGQIATGVDPAAEKRRQRAIKITLGEVLEDYLTAHSNLKAATVHDYRYVMHEAFADWQNVALSKITKDMVAKRHRERGERSRARADNAMRVLRALFNFAAGQYEDETGRSFFPENPVKRLSHNRAWYRVGRRRTVIEVHQLKPWYRAVATLKSERSTSRVETVRDYLLFLLFTGLRRGEAASLMWESVDLDGRKFTVRDTKNREDHTLPLSDFVYDLLKRRYEARTSDFVFPGGGTRGYVVEPRRWMTQVTEQSGVAFTLHDLRRTFATTAERLDLSHYAVKRLINHKTGGDVTAGYIVSDVERLREPMQRIADFLKRAMDIEKTDIVSFERVAS